MPRDVSDRGNSNDGEPVDVVQPLGVLHGEHVAIDHHPDLVSTFLLNDLSLALCL